MNPTNPDIPDNDGLHKPDDATAQAAETPATAPDDEIPLTQMNGGNNPRSSWPVSLNNLRGNVAHMRPEAAQTVVDCFLYAIQNDISKAEFADAIGSTDLTVYKIITGRYLNPETRARLDLSPKMLDAMIRWLESQKTRDNVRTDFVMTPTAVKIWLACDIARESCTPVFIFGPSQLGKSVGLIKYRDQHNHGRTIYVRIAAASGLGELLRGIAKAIGTSTETTKNKMMEYIIKGLSANMIIILDEVHELLLTSNQNSFITCIEAIREIFDRVGCGMVLCVTKIKWDEISQQRKSDLEQMFRRGVHRYALGTVKGQPLKGDIKALIEAQGLTYPNRKDIIEVMGIKDSPYEILRQLATDDGLKSIAERLRYASKFAAKDGRTTPTWTDFVTAHLTIKQSGLEAPAWE